MVEEYNNSKRDYNIALHSSLNNDLKFFPRLLSISLLAVNLICLHCLDIVRVYIYTHTHINWACFTLWVWFVGT